QGSVGSWLDQQNFIRLSRHFRSSHINRDDFGTPVPSRDDVAGRIWVAGDVWAPKNEHPLVLSHILLCVDFSPAGSTHAHTAEPAADHRWVPSVAAVHIGEAAHHLNRDSATRRKSAMACP